MTYKKKVCALEGCCNVFVPRSSTSLYCGEICRSERKKIRNSLTNAKKRGLVEFVSIECASPECNVVFIRKSKRHKYCCTACKSVASAYGSRLKDSVPRVCKNRSCSREFVPHNGNQSYCCKGCRDVGFVDPERKVKKYDGEYFKKVKYCSSDSCEKSFRPQTPAQKYCSNKCKGRNAYYLRVYGISESQFNKMKEEQKGRCFICNSVGMIISKFGKERLAVDHCHKTGNVRRLLCHNCNRALGLAKDDPRLLRLAASYLREFNTNIK
tara:strand:- start:4765 stop:5568 length:804 start_codon:yes stop_codon:yes gene_type:complete